MKADISYLIMMKFIMEEKSNHGKTDRFNAEDKKQVS